MASRAKKSNKIDLKQGKKEGENKRKAGSEEKGLEMLEELPILMRNIRQENACSWNKLIYLLYHLNGSN